MIGVIPSCPITLKIDLLWGLPDCPGDFGHIGHEQAEMPGMVNMNTESIVMSINTKIMFNYNRTCTP